MGKPNKPPFIIFSVFQTTLGELENTNNHLDAAQYLRNAGIKSKQVHGVYTHERHGSKVQELSILVCQSALPKVILLAQRYNQESLLIVNADRSAQLRFADGSLLPVGQWQVTTKEGAMREDNYTFDQSTGEYYVTL